MVAQAASLINQLIKKVMVVAQATILINQLIKKGMVVAQATTFMNQPIEKGMDLTRQTMESLPQTQGTNQAGRVVPSPKNWTAIRDTKAHLVKANIDATGTLSHPCSMRTFEILSQPRLGEEVGVLTIH